MNLPARPHEFQNHSVSARRGDQVAHSFDSSFPVDRFPALPLFFSPVAAAQDSLGGRYLELKSGWSLQSSAKVTGNGASFSQPGSGAPGWYTTSVPTTVVGALVDFRVYPDPYFSDNLRHYPGMSYKARREFLERGHGQG